MGTIKNFTLGYEIDCLTGAIEGEMDKKECQKLEIRLKECYVLAEKQFGSVTACINECLNN